MRSLRNVLTTRRTTSNVTASHVRHNISLSVNQSKPVTPKCRCGTPTDAFAATAFTAYDFRLVRTQGYPSIITWIDMSNSDNNFRYCVCVLQEAAKTVASVTVNEKVYMLLRLTLGTYVKTAFIIIRVKVKVVHNL